MRHGGEIIGALNIYSREPREWSDEDIPVAVVLADMATSYVLNAAKLHDQEQLSDQLQQALESRVVIEQAKGITAQRKSVTVDLSLIHISEPTRLGMISYAVFCLKK